MSDYPEHDKLRPVAEKSQQIGLFLDLTLPRLFDGLRVCEHIEVEAGEWEWVPTRHTIQDILAEAFGIDQAALALEKDQILAQVRSG